VSFRGFRGKFSLSDFFPAKNQWQLEKNMAAGVFFVTVCYCYENSIQAPAECPSVMGIGNFFSDLHI
jgi:hypothetical protein